MINVYGKGSVDRHTNTNDKLGDKRMNNSDEDSGLLPATTEEDSTPTLIIPGLPNDIATLILSRVPYAFHDRLKATSKSWKRVLSSKSFLSSLKRNHLICIFPQDPSIAKSYLFDPINMAWCPLPPMPINPHVYGLCNFAAVPFGPHIYILGGSLFDTRSFPIDRPSPTSSTFRFNFHDFSWEHRAPMLTPRGSFACASFPSKGQILVAGGGSRHVMFAAAGTRIRSAERYDVENDCWVKVNPLPGFRAGCVGFAGGGGREFWVMGGYSATRRVSRIFPVDEYCRDAVVMGLEDGTWRELGDMWDDERAKPGKVVVVDDQVFMLVTNEILRYDMSSNSWLYEARVPRRGHFGGSPFGFVALNRELYVLAHSYDDDFTETRISRRNKRTGIMCFQVYNPEKKMWKTVVTKSPFNYPIDLNSTVLSTICL